jgi:glycosyltransferase involved in cell wall biosynthesis
MKIMVDGQTLGTPEMERGIGKAFLEVFREMIDGNPRHEWFLVLRDQTHFDRISSSLRRSVTPIVLAPLVAAGEQTEWCRAYGHQLQAVAESIHADVYWNPNPLMPNVHYPSGFTYCPVVVTLHDLIPLVMKEQFQPTLGDALWRDYMERCSDMTKPNRWVVAVSEASASDFRRFYPKHRCAIRVIYHASNYSRLWPYRQGDRLSDPHYVLYVGGFDPRKNMDNALRAFAAFAVAPGRESVRFKVVCGYDESSRDRYFGLARVLGVADRLDLTGYVPDEELAFIFRGASVFFFPSLYEGFGLPVLDALACGVPVVASRTSSIPEVGGDHAIYCDPTDISSMSRALDQAWQQRDPNGQTRIAAVAHARSFRWEKSAQQYIAVFEAAALSRGETNGHQVSRKLRIAYLSPWPPQKSGVADYSYRLMPSLLKELDVTVFAENPHACLPMLGLEIRSLDSYPECAATFDNAIYHLGNGLTHLKIYEHAWLIPGVIVLHDYNIHPFFHFGFLGCPREPLYEEAIKEYGDEGHVAWAHYQTTGHRPDVWQFPMSHPIARRSRATVVHSRWVSDQLTDVQHIVRVHHGAQIEESLHTDDQQLLRERLSLTENAYWIGIFGFVNRHKRVESVLRAAKNLLTKGYPIRILIVGEVNDDTLDIIGAAKTIGVSEILRLEGYVTESQFLEYMRAVDIVCNLRYPTMGESSGSMFHALALSKATLVSDCGAFSEIPDRAAWKVDPLTDEIEHLSYSLELLLRNAPARRTIGANARDFISIKASMEHVAHCYVQTIQETKTIELGTADISRENVSMSSNNSVKTQEGNPLNECAIIYS